MNVVPMPPPSKDIPEKLEGQPWDDDLYAWGVALDRKLQLMSKKIEKIEDSRYKVIFWSAFAGGGGAMAAVILGHLLGR